MSETATEDTGDTGEVETTGADSAGHEEDQAAEEALHGVMQENDPEELAKDRDHWRKLAQRHEKTARTNSDAAKQLKAIEDANKSELQKAQEAAQAAEERANTVTQQNERMLAAAAHNLSPDLIDFIGGGSAEEITERAERLNGVIEAEVAKRVQAAQSQDTPNGSRQRTGGRPRENLGSMRAGSAPANTGVMTSDQMFRQLISGDQD